MAILTAENSAQVLSCWLKRGRLPEWDIWPPCTNLFRSAAFDIRGIIHFFTKQSTLIRRLSVLILPLL
jgi:hypothetical protein